MAWKPKQTRTKSKSKLTMSHTPATTSEQMLAMVDPLSLAYAASEPQSVVAWSRSLPFRTVGAL